jgi:predicted dehydrogenase
MFRWGMLGASSFGQRHMVPALRAGRGMEITAIASRKPERAEQAARALGVPRACSSYEALLADPAIDGVYIPLPNHLHVPWAVRAAEAGKHVLCEKPIALHAAEAQRLIDARDRHRVLIQEAAMVRFHPRWLAVRDLLRQGTIGEPRVFIASFAYNVHSRSNVRYDPTMGGGALLDVGFYPVTMSRFCFGAEPTEVAATLERDPQSGVDRLVSGVLRFPGGLATFACGMQLAPYQRVEILGTGGHMELEVAWNPPVEAPSRLVIDRAAELEAPEQERVELPPANPYTLMAERFVEAARDGAPAPLPLEDSVRNMAVLDALFRSAESGKFERPEG